MIQDSLLDVIYELHKKGEKDLAGMVASVWKNLDSNFLDEASFKNQLNDLKFTIENLKVKINVLTRENEKLIKVINAIGTEQA